jgi:hypothetical protein
MNVYFAKAGDYLKIGVTKDVGKRTALLQTGNPIKLELCGFIPNLDRKTAYHYEKKLHIFFSKLRVSGEWFHAPRFECYDNESRTIVYGDGGIDIGAIIK